VTDRAVAPAGSGGVLVTGGGTAGHAVPALAILDRLVARGHDVAALTYIGTQRGIERNLLTGRPYDAHYLDVVGLQRALTRRNLMFLPKLVRSTWRAFRLLGRRHPGVVVNVGGYGSMPATFAAVLRRIPLVVVSYDLRPGLASKLSARVARATAAAFEGSPLPRAHRTGAPLRPEVIAVDRAAGRAAARAELGIPDDRRLITVFGGSLGARVVNEAVVGVVERWSARSDVAVHHVVGERFLAEVPPSSGSAEGIMYDVVGYESRMALLYAASDLMVTRAGASTIAELAATGTPAIVVPWPDAAENHQLDNARSLSDIGAAVLLEQHELSVDRLAAELSALLDDDIRRAAVADAARVAGALHRGDTLLELIESVMAR
jgi:UDP-N-acetylglucosamine--N-acetylmuramyl-(pentapeptide) pyrophosphoryl-undecaprenol N-acetylglucosamine transferase